MLTPRFDIRPEHRVLLAVLRGDVAAARERRDAGTWQRLLPLAREHRILSLVAARLGALATEPGVAAPSDVIDRARGVLHDATGISFVLREKLDRYVAALDRAGVPSVALKGAALARSVYPAPEQRLAADLDILVPEDRVGAALEALAAVGVRQAKTAERFEHDARWHFHHQLQDDAGFVIELHWELTRPHSPWALHGAGVLERGVSHDGGPRLASPEDLVLHGAAQFLAEGFIDLLRLCDLDAVIRRAGDRLDWQAIALRGRAGRLAPTLDLMLRLAADLLATPRPEGAALLETPRSVLRAVRPLRPDLAVLTRLAVSASGYKELLRFWLLPGARRTVLRHTLLGDPRDRTKPGTLTGGSRLLLKRAALIVKLIGVQLGAMLAGPGTHESSPTSTLVTDGRE